MSALHHVILDTDIGSDVDDALALAQIIGTPEIDLLSVTTVYGDTTLRARLARRLGSLADRSIEVHAGLAEPLSGRPVWWAGHEGSLHDGLENESFSSEDAVGHLVKTITESPGTVDLVAIGPLTNIAAAIAADDRFAPSVRHLWVMGGAFADDEPEHNFRSDASAAATVLAARIPTTITGLEVTRQIEIREDQLTRIQDAGPLGRSLTADIKQWWDYWNEEWNVPHDPVTVLTLARPDLFGFGPAGTVAIAQDGEEVGTSTFTPEEHGWIRLATSVDAERAGEAIVVAIVRAGAPAAQHHSPRIGR